VVANAGITAGKVLKHLEGKPTTRNSHKPGVTNSLTAVQQLFDL
jgi:hypothetical protein